MFSVITLHISPLAILGVFAAAATIAGFIGAATRRQRDEFRSRQRTKDAVEGWRDPNGGWHIGVIQKVDGYWDEDGKFHAGLVQAVARLDRQAKNHRESTTAHGGGTR